jgi:hypothetical protein
MFDTLDDVFLMLPFSIKKEARIIRPENGITDEQWQKRCNPITAEHRLPAAKEQLVLLYSHGKLGALDSSECIQGSRQPVPRQLIPKYDYKRYI